jgi:hypothetical protein
MTLPNLYTQVAPGGHQGAVSKVCAFNWSETYIHKSKIIIYLILFSIFNDFNLDTIKNGRLNFLKTFLKSIKLLSGGKRKKYRKTKKNNKKLKKQKSKKKII